MKENKIWNDYLPEDMQEHWTVYECLKESEDSSTFLVKETVTGILCVLKWGRNRQAEFLRNEMEIMENMADRKLSGIPKTYRIFEENGEVFGTRASIHQYEIVKKKLPQVQYDEVSKILKIEKNDKKLTGRIAVCSAGTADIPVAEEAAQTAEFFGTYVDRIYDVGVSGLHRLLSKMEVIKKANCVVAVAGMEGALASVLGGLVKNPVIAVPTSVGYGASMGGLSALLTMINSCANGVTVVNIDNGFGAGYVATQINRLAGGK